MYVLMLAETQIGKRTYHKTYIGESKNEDDVGTSPHVSNSAVRTIKCQMLVPEHLCTSLFIKCTSVLAQLYTLG
jgi:hypothetical protein